jgi:hypothetical protein
MKKLILLAFVFIASNSIKAQPLGIFDVNVGLQTGKFEGTKSGKSFDAVFETHGSVIDYLINGEDNKLRIGDYIGTRMGIGIPGVVLGVDLGVQAAYGTEEANVGLKYMWKNDMYYTVCNFSGSLKYWGLNGRIKNIYGEILLGNNKRTGKNGIDITGRYIFKKNTYFGIEYKNPTYSYGNIECNSANLICLNIGKMF